MYKLSRHWNRLAYFVLRIGQRMIWDQTGKNKDILEDVLDTDKTAENIMCGRRDKIRIIHTCSDFKSHEHRYRWVAFLCGRFQYFFAAKH